MIGKAGLAFALMITGVASVHTVDLRQLYNQMYPVSTLKRDTLNLCHEADPAFIRAIKEDRQACYRSMPHAIAVALGMVRPDNALAELFTPLGGLLGAGTLAVGPGIAAWVAETRAPPISPPHITSAAAGPCPEPARSRAAITTQTALDALSGRRGAGEDQTLAQLGLSPSPAAGPSPPVPGAAPVGNRLTLLDAAPAADLGDGAVTPDPPATRCSAPI